MADVEHGEQTIADGLHGFCALGPWANEAARLATNSALTATDLNKCGWQTDTTPSTLWAATQITPSVVWTQIATGAHLTLGTGHDNAARGDAPAAAVANIPTASPSAAGLMTAAQATTLAAAASRADLAAAQAFRGTSDRVPIAADAGATVLTWPTGKDAIDSVDGDELVIVVAVHFAPLVGQSAPHGFVSYQLHAYNSGGTVTTYGDPDVTSDHLPTDWVCAPSIAANAVSVSATPTALQGARVWAEWDQLASNLASIALGATPAHMVLTGQTGVSIALAGTGTVWTPGTPGSPTFTASAGTITGQVVSSGTAASLTYTAPGTAGNVTITDPDNATTATVAVRQTATGYTLDGPTTGVVGAASTNFTVALPAVQAVAAAVTVTPSDGGAGGTFVPTSVQLDAYSLADSATFTYTPAGTAGSRSISVTNNGGLTNPAAIDMTVTETDTTAPVITGGAVAGTSDSWTIPITGAAATGDPANWCVVTNGTPPANMEDGRWSGSATAPTQAVVTSDGTYTVELYAADLAGNISLVWDCGDCVVSTAPVAIWQDLFNRTAAPPGNGWTWYNPEAGKLGSCDGADLLRTDDGDFRAIYNSTDGTLPADYYAEVTVENGKLNSGYWGFAARFLAAGHTGVQIFWAGNAQPSGTVAIGYGALTENTINAVVTVTGGYPASWALDQDHTVGLGFVGTTVTIYLDRQEYGYFTADYQNQTGTAVALTGTGRNLRYRDVTIYPSFPG